jgi:hypothetical protein
MNRGDILRVRYALFASCDHYCPLIEEFMREHAQLHLENYRYVSRSYESYADCIAGYSVTRAYNISEIKLLQDPLLLRTTDDALWLHGIPDFWNVVYTPLKGKQPMPVRMVEFVHQEQQSLVNMTSARRRLLLLETHLPKHIDPTYEHLSQQKARGAGRGRKRKQ